VKPFVVPAMDGLTPTYFVRLSLTDSTGKYLSDNFYWLSTKPVQFDWEKTTYFSTPATQDADMTMLNTLPQAEITGTSRFEHQTGGETVATVTLKNPSKTLAFMTHLRLRNGHDGNDILPVFWDDNYISLLPGEQRVITGTAATQQLTGTPWIYVEGWNVAPKSLSAASAAK
jgi:exo-1,4-beta-D-glucosaminidase